MEAVKPTEVPAVPRTDWKGHFSKESYHWEPGALVRGAPPGERSIPPPILPQVSCARAAVAAAASFVFINLCTTALSAAQPLSGPKGCPGWGRATAAGGSSNNIRLELCLQPWPLSSLKGNTDQGWPLGLSPWGSWTHHKRAPSHPHFRYRTSC